MNPMTPMKNEHKTIYTQTNFSQTMKAKEKEKILKTSENQLMTWRAVDTIDD